MSDIFESKWGETKAALTEGLAGNKKKTMDVVLENTKRYLVKGSKIHSKTINLYTVESNISKQLGIIQKKYKKFVDIGSYPFFRLGKIGVSIVTRSSSLIKLRSVNKELLNLVKSKKIELLKL